MGVSGTDSFLVSGFDFADVRRRLGGERISGEKRYDRRAKTRPNLGGL